MKKIDKEEKIMENINYGSMSISVLIGTVGTFALGVARGMDVPQSQLEMWVIGSGFGMSVISGLAEDLSMSVSEVPDGMGSFDYDDSSTAGRPFRYLALATITYGAGYAVGNLMKYCFDK